MRSVCLCRNFVQQSFSPVRAFVRRESMVCRSSIRIDSHLHVWATVEESRQFPYQNGKEAPDVRGNTAYLVELMENVGVDKAMIVQSSLHGFDHSYVQKAIKEHPDKFVGCLLANPDDSGVGVQEMEGLVKDHGFKCVRFNPYIWPEGEKMTNEIGRRLFLKAGELSVPVGFMLFKGFMFHVEEVEILCLQYPSTKVILDHFGFSKRDEEAWEKLLQLANYPQIYVKSSAFFRNSSEQFPYLDMRDDLRRLIDAYGIERIFWGTDFPWVVEPCGYVNAWNIIQEGDKVTGKALLSTEEIEWIEGKSFEKLFLT